MDKQDYPLHKRMAKRSRRSEIIDRVAVFVSICIVAFFFCVVVSQVEYWAKL